MTFVVCWRLAWNGVTLTLVFLFFLIFSCFSRKPEWGGVQFVVPSATYFPRWIYDLVPYTLGNLALTNSITRSLAPEVKQLDSVCMSRLVSWALNSQLFHHKPSVCSTTSMSYAAAVEVVFFQRGRCWAREMQSVSGGHYSSFSKSMWSQRFNGRCNCLLLTLDTQQRKKQTVKQLELCENTIQLPPTLFNYFLSRGLK